MDPHSYSRVNTIITLHCLLNNNLPQTFLKPICRSEDSYDHRRRHTVIPKWGLVLATTTVISFFEGPCLPHLIYHKSLVMQMVELHYLICLSGDIERFTGSVAARLVFLTKCSFNINVITRWNSGWFSRVKLNVSIFASIGRGFTRSDQLYYVKQKFVSPKCKYPSKIRIHHSSWWSLNPKSGWYSKQWTEKSDKAEIGDDCVSNNIMLAAEEDIVNDGLKSAPVQ